MARAFSVMQPHVEPTADEAGPVGGAPRPRRKPHARRTNAPTVHTRAHLLRMPGVDLVALHGISESLAQILLAEIGPDMRQGPDDHPCCSWLGWAPKNDLAGGQVFQSRTLQTRPRAAPAFRMAAQSVLRADCALGAFSRRVQGRLGPAQALVATAHTSARTGYHMLQERVPYHDLGAAESHQRFRARALQYLQKKAAKLGYARSPA